MTSLIGFCFVEKINQYQEIFFLNNRINFFFLPKFMNLRFVTLNLVKLKYPRFEDNFANQGIPTLAKYQMQ
jgi:hypothetical protein